MSPFKPCVYVAYKLCIYVLYVCMYLSVYLSGSYPWVVVCSVPSLHFLWFFKDNPITHIETSLPFIFCHPWIFLKFINFSSCYYLIIFYSICFVLLVWFLRVWSSVLKWYCSCISHCFLKCNKTFLVFLFFNIFIAFWISFWNIRLLFSAVSFWNDFILYRNAIVIIVSSFLPELWRLNLNFFVFSLLFLS